MPLPEFPVGGVRPAPAHPRVDPEQTGDSGPGRNPGVGQEL